MSEPKLEIIDKKIIAIEPKLDRFVDIFEKCLGISIEKDIQGNSNFSLKDKCFPICLADTLEGIEDFEVVLETLNRNENDRGVSFKKGRIRADKNGVSEKYIVCKFKDRNKDNHKQEDLPQDSNKNKKILIKLVDCPVYYRFGIEIIHQILRFKRS